MEKKTKNVQIPLELFLDCYKLIVCQLDDAELWNNTANILEAKLQKMINRNLYTKYKTASSEEEKEAARIRYLDNIGIPKNYRW